jgi:hypothetical protein
MKALTPTKPGESPAFTTDDVKAYLLKTPVPSATRYNPQAITVVAIDFVTSKDASARLGGEPLGLPDSRLVCFALLQGSFTFSGPPGGGSPSQATYSNVVEIFDAQTGNLLLVGGLGRA